MRDRGWEMQDPAFFFKAKEIQRNKEVKIPSPYHLLCRGSGLGGFSLFCFVFQVSFSELFLKCTFYKVYQVFSYLKPNVNRGL